MSSLIQRVSERKKDREKAVRYKNIKTDRKISQKTKERISEKIYKIKRKEDDRNNNFNVF